MESQHLRAQHFKARMCYLVVSSFVPDLFLKNGRQININNNCCGLNVAKCDFKSAVVYIASAT